VQYFCQTANIPGVSIGNYTFNTPLLDVPGAGNKISYNEFRVTFYINEDLSSFNELYKWFLAIASPKNLTDRNLHNSQQDGFNTKPSYYSDSTLTVMSALNNPIARINFHRMFPVSLSDIQFDTGQSSDNIITADAVFQYEYYDITTA
jgi:hypothetical protein